MIGVRTFDEISATMAEITGVSQNDPGVRAAFDEVRQSMPAIPSIEAYVSSHQAAIGAARDRVLPRAHGEHDAARCDVPGLRLRRSAGSGVRATRTRCSIRCSNRVLGVTQLAHQPDKNAARTELSQLVNGHPSDPARPGLLNALPGGERNDAARTRNIAKAVCAAVVGSAAMLVQ